MSSSHFDAIAERLRRVAARARRRALPAQAHRASCSSTARAGKALDVGCGTGVLAARLADAGYEMTGVDPSDGMLDVLRAPRAGRSRRSRPRAPSCRSTDDSFDVVLSVAVMHHIAEPGRRAARRWPRWCASRGPGGRVLVWDHNPRNPYWRLLMARVPAGHRRRAADPRGGGDSAACARPAPRSLRSDQLGLVPDFVPTRGAARWPRAPSARSSARRCVRRLGAHNVVLAYEARARRTSCTTTASSKPRKSRRAVSASTPGIERHARSRAPARVIA